MGDFDDWAEPVTLSRAGSGLYLQGRWSPGQTTTVTIQADVQPAKPRELVNLPEAQRARAAIKVYSETELRTADVEAQTAADVLTVKGRRWEVQSVEPWSGYCKAIATLMDPPAEGT
jgi:hypothetical protein